MWNENLKVKHRLQPKSLLTFRQKQKHGRIAFNHVVQCFSRL